MEPGVFDWCSLRIEALARLDRLDEAAALADDAEALAAARGRRSAIVALCRARGVLEAARGRMADAATAFERGEAQLAGLGMPFASGMFRLAYGTHLRRMGARRLAASQLQSALDAFAALGAVPYAERAEAELAVCGLTPRRRDAGLPLLSPREHAVARLVAEGLTNREIAERLFVSAKTVEYHLANAFTKLGVRGRAHLAARVTSMTPGDDN
jgi:DNA-binding CsgD family transcriptional regulator